MSSQYAAVLFVLVLTRANSLSGSGFPYLSVGIILRAGPTRMDLLGS